MFVLLLFTMSSALNLTQYGNFIIELDVNCREYFVFIGLTDYAYFHKKNEMFELRVTQNYSENVTNYAVYTTPVLDTLKFEWPAKTINDLPMELVLYEGAIEYPQQFQSEALLCVVYGVSAGSQYHNESFEEVYKYTNSGNWLLDLLSVVIVMLLLVLVGKHGPVQAILGPKISRFVWWSRQILPRSEENTSSSEAD